LSGVNFPTEFLHKNIRDLPCPCLSVGVNGAEFGNDPVTSKVKLKPPNSQKTAFRVVKAQMMSEEVPPKSFCLRVREFEQMRKLDDANHMPA